MKQNSTKKATIISVEPERSHFHFMLAKNPNYFGNIPGSKLKEVIKIIANPSYEQLTCVGYNPDTTEMEATFAIKKSFGYSGNLCTAGSFEYVRFYMDFHDGSGFIDQGSVAINVHDIPSDKDCHGQSIFPITYTATLKKKTRKKSFCTDPILPTLRAILSWNMDPPANSPGWKPVWGSVMDCDVQLKPYWKFNFDFDISQFFDYAKASSNISVKQLMDISGIDFHTLTPQPVPIGLKDIAKKYDKSNIPASRFAFKTIHQMVKFPSSEVTMFNKSVLADLKVNIGSIIDQIIKPIPIDITKANVDYEELECVGLDYNTESLVATIKIKKKIGYSGDMCDAGSKEYIAFWIDWTDSCDWEYLNTVQINVHDIKMDRDHLCYSVALPLNTLYHKKLCTQPNVIRVRAVLSWNIPPSTTNPNKLEYYGNRVDTHIQIKPGVVINPGDVIPLFNIIGGIDVDHVNDITGLTKPGSFFAFNGMGVPTGAPFDGVVVLNGPSFEGYRYRIKITNLDLGTFTYADNPFTVVGYLPYAPWVQYTTQLVDGDGYYPFLASEKNTLNVLARFTPSTSNKFLVEMEVDTVAGVFSKTIQMDNVYPDIKLQVNDGGDCTKYSKGDTITGHYYVNDLHISSWAFGSTWGGGASGTNNTPPLPGVAFSISTPVDAYPCGSVSLWAIDKTIIDSQSVGHYIPASYNICLQD